MTVAFAFASNTEVAAPVWQEAQKAWLLTRHADVQALLRDPTAQSIEFQAQIQGIALRAGRNYDHLVGLLSGILFFRNPPWQKQARSALHRGMSAIGARMSDADMGAVINDAVTAVEGHVEVVDLLANRIPVLVMAHLFGLSEATVEIMNRDGKGVVNAWQRALPLRVYSALEEQAAEIHGTLLREMGLARQQGGPLAVFLREFGAFEDAEVVGILFGLIMAGIETTSGLLSSTIYAMAADRNHLTSLRDGRLPERSFVEEVLRMAPPLRCPSARRLAEDRHFGEVTLPAGSLVSVDIMKAQRDPTVYDAPDRFEPRRAGTALLAFGNGAHACLGVHLAMLEARLLLRAALKFDLTIADAGAVRWDPDPTFCRLQHLEMTFTHTSG